MKLYENFGSKLQNIGYKIWKFVSCTICQPFVVCHFVRLFAFLVHCTNTSIFPCVSSFVSFRFIHIHIRWSFLFVDTIYSRPSVLLSFRSLIV